jgi:hypothetical protein
VNRHFCEKHRTYLNTHIYIYIYTDLENYVSVRHAALLKLNHAYKVPGSVVVPDVIGPWRIFINVKIHTACTPNAAAHHARFERHHFHVKYSAGNIRIIERGRSSREASPNLLPRLIRGCGDKQDWFATASSDGEPVRRLVAQVLSAPVHGRRHVNVLCRWDICAVTQSAK